MNALLVFLVISESEFFTYLLEKENDKKNSKKKHTALEKISEYAILCYNILDVYKKETLQFFEKNMDFKQKVIIVRAKLNLSQEALAKKLDVSFSTINRWEYGCTVPSRKTQYMFHEFCKSNGISIPDMEKK